jgi:hypothetical protein
LLSGKVRSNQHDWKGLSGSCPKNERQWREVLVREAT